MELRHLRTKDREGMSERPHVEAETVGQLEDWLRKHHTRRDAVWLVTFKKSAGARYLPYEQLVEALLAWGWIDSKPGTVDDLRTKVLIAPRKPASSWSRANRARVDKLTAEGRMQEPGLMAVATAKTSGAWGRLKAAESGRAPRDLSSALAKRSATMQWRALSLATRKRALEWLGAAKTPATRAKRIAAIAAAAGQGLDPTAWKPKR